MAPMKPDFLCASEKAEADALGGRPFQLDEHRDDDGAADEIVACAGVDDAVAELELAEVPHGKATVAADAGVLGAMASGTPPRNCMGCFSQGAGRLGRGNGNRREPSRVIHVRGEGVAGRGQICPRSRS